MNVESLAKACAEAIGRGSHRMTLVLPGVARGNTRRLLGKSGPKGEVIADTESGGRPESLVAFDPNKVLAWLAAKGLVRVEVSKSAG